MLPILEDVDAPRAVPVHQNVGKMEYYKAPAADNTQLLLNEFQTLYDVVEFTNALTPPQSPPSDQPMFTTLEPLLAPQYHQQQQHIPDAKQTAIYAPVPESKPFRATTAAPIDYQQVATPQPADIAHELAVVEELVRTRVEDMQWSSSSGPSSPNSSSCGSSNFGDCTSDDPEWVPETIEGSAEAFSSVTATKVVSRKRSKPYSRGSNEDKKSRKKEQNKNAATRYRMKKKAEVEVILTEEKILLDHNNDLCDQITDLQREIKYLKGLMRDLFKAKGLIN